MADKQKLLPYKPVYADHKLLTILYWLIAIGLWPITIAVVLIRLAMRISRPQLRYVAFAVIAIFTLFNGVVWAAMYAATNSSSTQPASQHQTAQTKQVQTTTQPKPAATRPTTSATTNTPSQQPTPAPASTASACDASLWNHVYHSYRLTVLKSCTTVTGTIDHIIHEKDGDTHIRLKLDTAYTSMLNSKNVSDQYGDLVLEPVCEESPTQTDAIGACTGYRSDVVVPAVGTHVGVNGSYVLDTDHGWNEIHPVTSITVTP